MSDRNPDHKFTAIWDTGATHSVISQHVVDTCQLHSVGARQALSVSGSMKARLYFVDIVLPNKFKCSSVRVIKAKLGIADVLIGMDIIQRGDFAVTNFNNATTFSFRTPSLERIDFKQRTKEQ